MSMSLTWIAILASLLMGVGALLIFILAVKQDYFRNLEETKYHRSSGPTWKSWLSRHHAPS
jgi:hypothetical protein